MKRLGTLGLAFFLAACGPDTATGSHNNSDGGGKGNKDGGGTVGDGGNGGGSDFATCSGLECLVDHSCAGGAKTTLTGTVFAPNGTLPLYNATVFIPNTDLDPFTDGVTCDRCDGTVSGSPVAIALTGPDGKFTLTDVPTGTNIPLVIQMGRWRRIANVPSVTGCTTAAIPEATTRLPKNSSEGHLPKMALVSGDADPFECLLLKVGIDKAEITKPSDGGRIHFYLGTDDYGLDLQSKAPSATELYKSLDSLLAYDVVLLPCEGGEYDKSRVNDKALSPNPRGLFEQYVNAGGRVFATHYSYAWLTYDQSPFNKVATPLDNGLWPVGQPDDYDNTIAADLVTTFPKGKDFASWLQFAGATSPVNKLNIDQGRHDVTGVDPMYAQSWATYDFTPVGGGPGVMHFTFNAPLDPPKDAMGNPEYCGRVVFSDFHVTAGALVDNPTTFPSACNNGAMTDQEKALAFMLFDLSSCVQADSQPPIP